MMCVGVRLDTRNAVALKTVGTTVSDSNVSICQAVEDKPDVKLYQTPSALRWTQGLFMYAEVHHHHHTVGIMYDCVFSEVWTNPDETLQRALSVPASIQTTETLKTASEWR